MAFIIILPSHFYPPRNAKCYCILISNFPLVFFFCVNISSFDNMVEDYRYNVIVTYWNLFEQHEKSHADVLFKKPFSELGDFCDATYEVGYEMLWQGVPKDD